MAYEVIVTPIAERAVARLPKVIRARIASRLAELSANPRPSGSIKLTNQDLHRIRVGDYRILYAIKDDRLLVLVVDVGHRGDVYRRR